MNAEETVNVSARSIVRAPPDDKIPELLRECSERGSVILTERPAVGKVKGFDSVQVSLASSDEVGLYIQGDITISQEQVIKWGSAKVDPFSEISKQFFVKRYEVESEPQKFLSPNKENNTTQGVIKISNRSFDGECIIQLLDSGARVRFVSMMTNAKGVDSDIKQYYKALNIVLGSLASKDQHEAVFFAQADHRSSMSLTERAIAPDPTFHKLIEVAYSVRTGQYLQVSDTLLDELIASIDSENKQVLRGRVSGTLREEQLKLLKNRADDIKDILKANPIYSDNTSLQNKFAYFDDLYQSCYIAENPIRLQIMLELERAFRLAKKSDSEKSILDVVFSIYESSDSSEKLSEMKNTYATLLRYIEMSQAIREDVIAPSYQEDTIFEVMSALQVESDLRTSESQEAIARYNLSNAFHEWFRKRGEVLGENSFGSAYDEYKSYDKKMAGLLSISTHIRMLAGELVFDSMQFTMLSGPKSKTE